MIVMIVDLDDAGLSETVTHPSSAFSRVLLLPAAVVIDIITAPLQLWATLERSD